MSSTEIFGKKFIAGQKERLLSLKEELLGHMRSADTDDLKTEPEEMLEDADLASQARMHNVAIGLRSRDLDRLRDIEHALERIEQGTYGICEDTEEPIEKKRLMSMPWARLSLQAQEERESAIDYDRTA